MEIFSTVSRPIWSFGDATATCVLPPVSILTPEQTQYYFLSGFTAKLAGTERGITEPTPTFSACFGQAFLELHPTIFIVPMFSRRKIVRDFAKIQLIIVLSWCLPATLPRARCV